MARPELAGLRIAACERVEPRVVVPAYLSDLGLVICRAFAVSRGELGS
jgi:hypothetical protein